MTITVSWQDAHHQPRAEQIARQLNLPLLTPSQFIQGAYRLQIGERVELQVQLKEGISALSVDFIKGSLGYRRRHGGGVKQALARAVGLKNNHQSLFVIDATAGLG